MQRRAPPCHPLLQLVSYLGSGRCNGSNQTNPTLSLASIIRKSQLFFLFLRLHQHHQLLPTGPCPSDDSSRLLVRYSGRGAVMQTRRVRGHHLQIRAAHERREEKDGHYPLLVEWTSFSSILTLFNLTSSFLSSLIYTSDSLFCAMHVNNLSLVSQSDDAE